MGGCKDYNEACFAILVLVLLSRVAGMGWA